MKPLGKMMALVMLVTVISPVGLAYGSIQTPRQNPAGCHQHGQKAPTSNPVSYECCRAGHQFAAVREALELRSALLPLSQMMESSIPSSPEPAGQAQSRPPAFGSPGVTSLRI